MSYIEADNITALRYLLLATIKAVSTLASGTYQSADWPDGEKIFATAISMACGADIENDGVASYLIAMAAELHYAAELQKDKSALPPSHTE